MTNIVSRSALLATVAAGVFIGSSAIAQTTTSPAVTMPQTASPVAAPANPLGEAPITIPVPSTTAAQPAPTIILPEVAELEATATTQPSAQAESTATASRAPVRSAVPDAQPRAEANGGNAAPASLASPNSAVSDDAAMMTAESDLAADGNGLEAVPVAAADATASSDSAEISSNGLDEEWLAGGAGLLALFGLGGLAVAYGRHRKNAEMSSDEVVETAPVTSVAADRVPQPVAVKPRDLGDIGRGAFVTAPVVAASPAATQVRERANEDRKLREIFPRPTRTVDADMSVLEAMVALPPSAVNPFLTRKNRMRRARFILENSQRGVATDYDGELTRASEAMGRPVASESSNRVVNRTFVPA